MSSSIKTTKLTSRPGSAVSRVIMQPQTPLVV